MVLIIVFSMFLPTVSSQEVHDIEKVKVICHASGNETVNISGREYDLFGNGTRVEEVECDNLEAYGYSNDKKDYSEWVSEISSLLAGLIMVLAPASFLLFLGIGIGHLYSLDREELSKILGISAGVMVSTFSMIYLVDVFSLLNSSITMDTKYFVIAINPFISSLLVFLKSTRDDVNAGSPRALIAFMFSSSIFWMVYVYLSLSGFLFQSPKLL